MTEKQKIFCDEYLVDLNGTRAYKAAYPNVKKDNSAASRANKLLKTKEVKEYIDKRLEELKDERIAKVEDVMIYLSDVMFGKSKASVLAMAGDGMQEIVEKPPDEKERLKAAELLGRRFGMFTEKLEVKDDERQQQKESISNIESLVKQMVQVEEEDIEQQLIFMMLKKH